MKLSRYVLPVLVAGCLTGSASAAIDAHLTAASLTPGVVSNSWTVDMDTDLSSMALYVVLTQGTVYDPFAASLTLDGDSLLITTGDTFFTANGNPQTGIAGAAGDLGHANTTEPGAAEVGPTVIGVSWFSPGSDTNDIGTGMPIGRFSFSDNAMGTWMLSVGNDAERQLFEGLVINGVMPEPASLALLGLGGLAMLRRR